jgi:serine/threonine protein phosphatase PrpC
VVAELARRLTTGDPVELAPTLRGAGLSDVGRQREVNEDRLHIDLARGIVLVVDGVGGQAAGGRAADIAVRVLRERLERQTGSPADRVREAITTANNEIFHAAQQRPEWRGMACVLTVAVIEAGRLIIGHVGDTRLYLIHAGQVRKLTPDHSPVGEREDARELSELEAMRHPRRNEVFRDVGSTVHHLADRDFIFLGEAPFPADAAILLCSDGLTDLVPIDAVRQTIETRKGRPDDIVAALVRAANDAGGRDNVTALYVEGDQFAGTPSARVGEAGTGRPVRSHGRWTWFVGVTLLVLLAGGGWWAWREGWTGRTLVTDALVRPSAGAIVVRQGESIADAIARAEPGFSIVVEPGEYHERLTLKDNVRLTSRVPRGATIRLPAGSSAEAAAVVAAGVIGAELSGFRIVGDDSTPLGVGVMTRDSGLRLFDMEISGASTAAVAFGAGDDTMLVGSDIHDNPGAALVAGPGATPRIAHNTFVGNGASAGITSPFVFESGARPVFERNVFDGVGPTAFATLDDEARTILSSQNVFIADRTQSPGARPQTPAPRSR